MDAIAELTDEQLTAEKIKLRIENRRKKGVSAVLKRLSSIKSEELTWLWPGRIPANKLTLLVGDPGVSKSTLSLEIAARVSRGFPLPDDAPAPFGDVLILSAEDDPADTIRPRLEAFGADLEHIHILEGGYQSGDDPGPRDFTLADIEILQDAVDRLEADARKVVLVIIDPLSAFHGAVDGNDNGQVRGALKPIAEFAGSRKVTILAIAHMRKAAATATVHRVAGSLAFSAAARAVWMVSEDRDDPAKRLFLPIKLNLSKKPDGLAFVVKDSGGLPSIEWQGAVKDTAEDVLEDDHAERKDAMTWIAEALKDGPVPSGKLREDAEADGLAWVTVKRAKGRLGVISKHNGMTGKWSWELPE